MSDPSRKEEDLYRAKQRKRGRGNESGIRFGGRTKSTRRDHGLSRGTKRKVEGTTNAR